MMSTDQLNQLFSKPAELKQHVAAALHEQALKDSAFLRQAINPSLASAVLFLLSPGCQNRDGHQEPCLVLNKRSERVRQPGDLCCPGGSIAIRKDTWLSRLLNLPFSPLARWRYWPSWIRSRNQEAANLAFLLATGMRESFEEMRLNPMRLNFLGPLPPQQLVMFERTIFPMVCWVPHQKKFSTNWEVERIVYIPLRRLLDSANYARFRLTIDRPGQPGLTEERVFPCFFPDPHDRSEKLWGVTFRITMGFLHTVFGFREPEIELLPEVTGQLEENYLTGNPK